jgi:hypothetical protein
MQCICDPSLLHGLPMATMAEVSRFAISKQLRGASSTLMRLALIQGLFRISYESGLTDWCATMENSLLRILKSSAIHFRPLGPLVEYHGPRQPCCANIAEVVARMRVDRPGIWDFATNHGLYYGSDTAVTTTTLPRKKVGRDWYSTVSGRTKDSFFPNFEPAGLAVLDANAPTQHYRQFIPVHHSSVVPPVIGSE